MPGKCENDGKSNAKLEKKSATGKKGFFCDQKCYDQYLKKSEAKGVCEFC